MLHVLVPEVVVVHAEECQGSRAECAVEGIGGAELGDFAAERLRDWCEAGDGVIERDGGDGGDRGDGGFGCVRRAELVVEPCLKVGLRA